MALMRRYLRLSGVSMIRLPLADREFTGHAWVDFLNENDLRFAIRLRENLRSGKALYYDGEGHQLRLDARRKDLRKLDLLIGHAALAIAWAARAAKDLLRTSWPKRKPKGYLAKSWIRTG